MMNADTSGHGHRLAGSPLPHRVCQVGTHQGPTPDGRRQSAQRGGRCGRASSNARHFLASGDRAGSVARAGFTLVEIMIVTMIVGVLAGIAMPNILRARQTAQDTKTQADLSGIFTAMVTYLAVNNSWPVDWSALRPYITMDESVYEFNPDLGG